MRGSKTLWKIYQAVSDVLEVYLPCLIFIFLFISYIILIFYRYVLKSSFDWLYELNSLAFVWCGIFAASYGSRSGTHVQFTILYDHVSPRLQMLMRVIGNVFVVAIFVMLFPKAVSNLDFMKVRKSSILKLPYNWVFAPFLIFMGLTILHHVLLIVKDIVSIFGGGKEERSE